MGLSGSGNYNSGLISSHALYVHDSSTGASTEASRGNAGGMDLIATANVVHDLFTQNPDTYSIALRAPDRSVVCKKLDMKESYFMQQPAPPTCFDAELDAAKIVYDEYGVRIL